MIGAAGVTLAVHGLTKRMGGRQVIDDLSLSVHPGECIALLGPSGAGKTTLVRALVGELGGDTSLYFHGQNRNKLCVTLDLKAPGAADAVLRLASVGLELSVAEAFVAATVNGAAALALADAAGIEAPANGRLAANLTLATDTLTIDSPVSGSGQLTVQPGLALAEGPLAAGPVPDLSGASDGFR